MCCGSVSVSKMRMGERVKVITYAARAMDVGCAVCQSRFHIGQLWGFSGSSGPVQSWAVTVRLIEWWSEWREGTASTSRASSLYDEGDEDSKLTVIAR
jgi:hypothetical protein